MDADAPRRLAQQYARYIDDRTFDRLAEIMAEDIQVGSPLFTCNSLAEFKEQLELLHNFRVTMHLVGNVFGAWTRGSNRKPSFSIFSMICKAFARACSTCSTLS